MRVYSRHLRLMRPVYCVDGTRDFFKQYGLDFKGFLRNGISFEELEKTGDPMARDIMDKVQELEG